MSDKLQDPTYQVHTFGCKVNTYDTSLIKQNLTNLGENESQPNVHILNSCAVTHEATKQAGKLARSLKKKDKDALVVLTGCAAQVDQKFFKDNQNIDLIVGNSHKGQLEDLILKKMNHEPIKRLHHNNIFKKEDTEFGAGLQTSKTRAFLKIQDGCNSFCSFCVIPFARGKSRSIEIQSLVNKINDFYKQGLREVILTGVHIGDYEDGHKDLADLVQALLKETDMPRFRLSSLEPVELSPKLLQSFENPRMCPHFHMSIQSAQTKILKAMKRKYSAKDVEWSLNKIHEISPQAFVGMDVIVGFPGETETEFQETYQRLESLPWTRIHVFPYSPRPKTRAMMMEGGLLRSEILQRSKTLRALSHQRWLEKAQAQVGTHKSVLLLSKQTQQGTQALSHDYWNVFIDPKELSFIPETHLNEPLEVKITDSQVQSENAQGYLLAQPLKV